MKGRARSSKPATRSLESTSQGRRFSQTSNCVESILKPTYCSLLTKLFCSFPKLLSSQNAVALLFIMASLMLKMRALAARRGLVATNSRFFWWSTSKESQQQQHVERGILFSAPCLDPKIPKFEPTTPSKPEMGILFSAPCLDPDVRAAMPTRPQSSGRIEKGILFSAPCLDMSRTGEYKKAARSFSTNTKIEVRCRS